MTRATGILERYDELDQIVVNLTLYNDETDETADIKTECEVEVTPTELEGGHLLVQGGFECGKYEFLPFKFNKKAYPGGTSLPAELLKYVDWSNVERNNWYKTYIIPAIKKNDVKILGKYIDNLVSDLFDREIDRKGYSAPINKY